MRRKLLAILASFAMIFTTLLPALADYPLLTITGNPLAPPAGYGANPYLVLAGLSGQPGCVMTINTAGGTMAVEGLYKGTTTWTPALTTVSPDGTTSQTSESATGSYAFNCANMVAVRVDGTAATGTPSVTLNAGGGVNRILGAGVNGGRTIVNGTSPITVTNSGNTATVGLTAPLTIAEGGTNATALPSGCLVSNGTTVSTQACGGSSTPTPVAVQGSGNIAVATPSPGVFVVSEIVTPAPAITPVSVQAGANVTVATPSAGTFVVSATTPSPAPTASISSTYFTVTNPSTNAFTINPTGAYTAPYSSPAAGCGSYNLVSTGVYQITGGLFSCSSATSGTFVVPAIGSTVSVPITAGFGVYAANTPLTITDGTHGISGNTTTASSITSTTLTFLVERINQGAVGNTMASGAEITTGGYDAGAGTVTGVTAGTNIVVSTPNPAAPTVSVTNSPTFTAVTSTTVTTNDIYAGVAGGTTTYGYRILGNLGGATPKQTVLLACASANAECTTAGVNGYLFDWIIGGSPTGLLSMDGSGNLGVYGYVASNSFPTSGGPYCLQVGALTNAQAISATTSPCRTKAEINLPLGFYAGTVNTSNVYPYSQVPAFSSGTIVNLRAACGTADNGTTVFTVTDVTSATTIGTIAMTASTTTTTTLGTPYALTTGHVITMTVTTAGTATNCGVVADGTQVLQ